MEQLARRKLAAIRMADVVEYGRHIGEDEGAAVRALKAGATPAVVFSESLLCTNWGVRPVSRGECV